MTKAQNTYILQMPLTGGGSARIELVMPEGKALNVGHYNAVRGILKVAEDAAPTRAGARRLRTGDHGREQLARRPFSDQPEEDDESEETNSSSRLEPRRINEDKSKA